MNRPFFFNKFVGILTFCLLALFVVTESRITATPQSRLIFCAGVIFSILVVLKRSAPSDKRPPRDLVLGWVSGGGALLAVIGIVMDVHQFQWLGLLLMTYAGFRWSLPEVYGRNVASALFILYWAHPLPGNLFGTIRLAMQQFSVSGAEWGLHVFNIPVWADHLLLRTGARVFEVPEACSGMNTAMIVVVCALGAGALSNLSVVQRVMLMGVGIVQVVIMNSARIALMVALSLDKPPNWSEKFLHDSTSALLLTMIVLIQGEAWMWNRIGSLRLPRRVRRSMNRAQRNVVVAISVLLLLSLVVLVAGRRSPAHRAKMIASVATMIGQDDLEQAERAAAVAARLDPDNLSHTLLLARIELARGKYGQAIARLQRVQPVPRDDTVIQLMAWGMLGAGRLADAQTLLSRLSPAQTAHPGIAMCVAELAVRRDDAETAASNVVLAVTWPVLKGRIRQTYPFLAHHGKWAAIAKTADPSFCHDATAFRIMLVALTAENDFPRVARLLESNHPIWFGKPDFLPNLQELALRDASAAWPKMFFDSLAACMGKLTADELLSCVDPCFLLGRPDLAWITYRRLSLLDPAHPALTLIPARYAANWYTFRGGEWGVESRSSSLLDLRPFLQVAAFLDPWKALLKAVPFGALMVAGPTHSQISEWVHSGLAELARRETKGLLTYEEYALYARSLQSVGRDAEVLDVLGRMDWKFPDRSVAILSRRAMFCRSRELWQPLYETLVRIRALRPQLDLRLQLTLAETLAHLEMGVCALELSAEAARQPQTAREGRLLQSSIYAQFGQAEEALFTLGPVKGIPPGKSMAELLWNTGRYAQAAQMYDLLGMRQEAPRQPHAMPLLPSAESVLCWPGRDAATPPLFSCEKLDRQIQSDTSPFLLKLHTLTRDWVGGQDRQRIANPAVWMRAGRDRLEQVSALHRLAFLAADSGDLPLAGKALDEALRLMPSARLLWRMRIAVSGGDAATIAAARAACPDDSEIWLAEFASQIRSRHVAAAARSLREVCAGNRYPSATVIRAGYALLGVGDASSASVAAKQALVQSRDYLPACLLGLDAAVASKEVDTAVTMALQIAELAPDSLPFLRVAVRLGMTRSESQPFLAHSLETLIMRDPRNPEWRLRLGSLYFKEGQFDLSRNAFDRLMLAPPAGLESGLLIMMAESARRSGELALSVAVMREAYRRYPKDINVINSLAYTLAQSPATVMEARSFLPRLKEAVPTASILDTMDMIRLRSGDTEALQRSTREALAKLKPGDTHWREIHLNAAEIECALGHVAEAEKLLKRAREQARPKGATVDEREASIEMKILAIKHAGR